VTPTGCAARPDASARPPHAQPLPHGHPPNNGTRQRTRAPTAGRPIPRASPDAATSEPTLRPAACVGSPEAFLQRIRALAARCHRRTQVSNRTPQRHPPIASPRVAGAGRRWGQVPAARRRSRDGERRHRDPNLRGAESAAGAGAGRRGAVCGAMTRRRDGERRHGDPTLRGAESGAVTRRRAGAGRRHGPGSARRGRVRRRDPRRRDGERRCGDPPLAGPSQAPRPGAGRRGGPSPAP
jgi:hypothetical protein